MMIVALLRAMAAADRPMEMADRQIRIFFWIDTKNLLTGDTLYQALIGASNYRGAASQNRQPTLTAPSLRSVSPHL